MSLEPESDPDPITPVLQGGGLPDDGEPGVLPIDPEGINALLGADGGIDFGSLMEQASNMQAQMLAAHEQAASQVVEGVAGGGAVRINVSGGFEFQSVVIDPSAVDPDDVEMLQDLVLAALRDAIEQVNSLQTGSVDLKALGLGGLFGD